MIQSAAIIAFVLPNFNAGGAERVMITVANHLDRGRFKPVLIVFDDTGPLRDIVAPDVEVINLHCPRVREGMWRLPRAVKACGAALVISTMVHVNMAVLMARFFMGGVPVVVREAITPGYFSDNFFKRLTLLTGYKLLYPWARKILSPTQMVFDEMPDVLRNRPERLQRIFNPVNLAHMAGDADATLRATLTRPEQRLFVAAGRLVHQKGFDRLIEALKDWRALDDWRLVILGEGPDHQVLQDMIDNAGLGGQIRLHGFEAAPWRYYAVADAFLLPSRHEGLPNVALEALAMGAPVIAAESAGGIAEIAAESDVADVMIATDMKEFAGLMAGIKPFPGITMRPSRLAESFSLPYVVSQYQNMFDDVLMQQKAISCAV